MTDPMPKDIGLMLAAIARDGKPEIARFIREHIERLINTGPLTPMDVIRQMQTLGYQVTITRVEDGEPRMDELTRDELEAEMERIAAGDHGGWIAIRNHDAILRNSWAGIWKRFRDLQERMSPTLRANLQKVAHATKYGWQEDAVDEAISILGAIAEEQGAMVDVRAGERALSADEVRTLYEKGPDDD